MRSFIGLLEDSVRRADSLLCVGLDPHPADLTEPTGKAAEEFCLRLIEATAGLAAAYKPNVAFFEALGAEGWRAVQDVTAAVPDGVPVILDAKRGDIASTAQAHARSAFEVLGADAITLSPYLGGDSLEPFLADSRHGVFLLCKTSNPGSRDLQDVTIVNGRSARPLYEHVAHLATGWNKRDNLGLVVGATHPEALAQIRAVASDLWILAPGIGAQGGDLASALQAGLRPDGLGLLIPVSRGIARAADPHAAAAELVAAIRREQRNVMARSAVGVSSIEAPFSAALAEGLLSSGCVRFGDFTLKSGLHSPIYLDLRRLISVPDLLAEVASAYQQLLADLEYDRLAALPYAALPIATAISLQGGVPMIYPRKDSKAYGTRSEIEGLSVPGERVAVIDDLATTGGSKFEAIDKLTTAGLAVRDVVVLIDRESGAKETLAAAGYRLHAVFTLTQLLDYWEHADRVPRDRIAEVRNFLLMPT